MTTTLDEKTEARLLLAGGPDGTPPTMSDRDVLDAAGLDAADDDAQRRVAAKLREWVLAAYDDDSIGVEPGNERNRQIDEAVGEIARTITSAHPLVHWELGRDLRAIRELPVTGPEGEAQFDRSPDVDTVVKEAAYHVVHDAARGLIEHVERHLDERRTELEDDADETGRDDAGL